MLDKAETTFRMLQNTGEADLFSYTIMAATFSQAGLYEKAQDVLLEMEQKNMLPVPNSTAGRHLFTTAMKVFNKLGKVDKVLALVETMRNARALDADAYAAIIAVYVKHDFLKEADELYWEMRDFGIEPNVYTKTYMIKIFGMMKKYQEAEDLFRKMQSEGIANEVTCTSMIEFYYKRQLYEESMRVFEYMKSVNLRATNYTKLSMIKVFGAVGNIQEALNLFSELSSQTTPRAILFVVILNALLMNGHHERAVEIFDRIPESVTVTRLMRVAMIKVYSALGRYEEATGQFELLRSIRDANQPAYVAMLEMMIARHEYEKVFQLYKQMIDSSVAPNTASMIPTLKALSYLKKVGEAEQIYAVLKKRGNVTEKVDVAMLGVYCRAGELRKAKLVFSQCPQNHLTYGFMILLYDVLGDFMNVVNMYDRMTAEHIESLPSMHLVIRAMANAGLIARAESIFDRLRTEVKLNEKLYVAMLLAYCDAGSFERGAALYEEMHAIGCHPSPKRAMFAMTTAIKIYGSLGHITTAEKIYQEAKEHACASVVTGNAMLHAYYQNKMFDKAEELFHHMKEDTEFLTDKYTLTTMIRLYNDSGRFVEAQNLFEQMDAEGLLDAPVCTLMLKVFADNDRLDDATRLFRWLESGGHCSEVVCGAMLAIYISKKEYRLAESTYVRLKAMHQPDQFMMYNMVKVYGALGNIIAAENVFQQLKADGHANEGLYAQMLAMYLENEYYGSMDSIFHELELSGLTPSRNAYLAMIKMCGRIGDVRRAEFYFGALKRARLVDQVGLQIMAETYAKNNEREGMDSLVKEMESIVEKQSSAAT